MTMAMTLVVILIETPLGTTPRHGVLFVALCFDQKPNQNSVHLSNLLTGVSDKMIDAEHRLSSVWFGITLKYQCLPKKDEHDTATN